MIAPEAHLTSSEPIHWIDGAGYLARLLHSGEAPWENVESCVAWLVQGVRLLQTDVLELPLAEIAKAFLGRRPQLIDAMGARQRQAFPIKTLLADLTLRDHVFELVTAACAALPTVAIVLTVLSSYAWTELAYRLAHGAAIEIEDDAAEAAADYLADFLRPMIGARPAGLLIDDGVVLTAEGRRLHSPMLNLAQHLRTPVGVRCDRLPVPAHGDDYSFLIVAQQSTSSSAIRWVPLTGAAPPQKRYFVRVPEDSRPEQVLEALALLRRG